MLHPRSALDHVSLVNNARRLASFLVAASAFGDEQNLAGWMNVPIELCLRTIRGGNTGIKRAVSNIQLVKPDTPRVILRGG